MGEWGWVGAGVGRGGEGDRRDLFGLLDVFCFLFLI